MSHAKPRKLIAPLVLTLTTVLAHAVVVSPAAAQTREWSPRAKRQLAAIAMEKANRTEPQRKIDSRLLMQIKAQRQDPTIRNLPTRQKARDTRIGDVAKVEIRAVVTASLLDAIRGLGGTVLRSYPNYNNVRAMLPLQALEQLAGRSDVRSIRPPSKRVVRTLGGVESEGVTAHGVNELLLQGIDGKGSLVCVISDGVDNLANNIADGELPNFINVLPDGEGTGTEGTAMLEIVHDLAPGADLGFSTAGESVFEFATNITRLVDLGCHIIVDDIGFPTDQPAFQDDVVTAAANAAVMSGVTFFSAGGNDGSLNKGTPGVSGVWEGFFADSGMTFDNGTSGQLHDFGGGDVTNMLMGDSDLVVLWWSEPLGHSANDYDLCLVADDLSEIFQCSTNTQDGDDNPLETINGAGEGQALAVIQTDGAEVEGLHLATFNEVNMEHGTEGRLFGHPGGEYVIAVAAVDARQANGAAFDGNEEVESFSSDGPRRIFFDSSGAPINGEEGVLRLKPDLSAADNVVTTTPGFLRFPGTSAAAPHAAAIAALIREAFDNTAGVSAKTAAPGPAQIKQVMIDTALDIEASGFDKNSGYGLIDARTAVLSIDPTPNVIENGDFSEGRTAWRFFGPTGFSAPGRVGRLTITGPSANTQLFQSGIPIKGGTFYELTFDAREPVSGHNMRVRLHTHEAPHKTLGLYVPVDVTKSWTTFSFVFQTPAGNVPNARVQFQVGNWAAAGDMYMIDNVWLIQRNDLNGAHKDLDIRSQGTPQDQRGATPSVPGR